MSDSNKAKFSIPSILAIVAAIASFTVGATFGMILAITAIVFGIVGVLLSLSAKKRGGIVSFASVAAGLIGIIAALVKASLYLFG
ncbi:hypothetical protein ACFQY0_12180 [Haloferula chungangensis]|uniref:DUF4190 domain-containing protein n=1 Tax=Haloferula chungangensis TaxID=1048331 RepID=A0ABW2L8S0_9BACT